MATIPRSSSCRKSRVRARCPSGGASGCTTLRSCCPIALRSGGSLATSPRLASSPGWLITGRARHCISPIPMGWGSRCTPTGRARSGRFAMGRWPWGAIRCTSRQSSVRRAALRGAGRRPGLASGMSTCSSTISNGRPRSITKGSVLIGCRCLRFRVRCSCRPVGITTIWGPIRGPRVRRVPGRAMRGWSSGPSSCLV